MREPTQLPWALWYSLLLALLPTQEQEERPRLMDTHDAKDTEEDVTLLLFSFVLQKTLEATYLVVLK
jgi:hypothetical protein